MPIKDPQEREIIKKQIKSCLSDKYKTARVISLETKFSWLLIRKLLEEMMFSDPSIGCTNLKHVKYFYIISLNPPQC